MKDIEQHLENILNELENMDNIEPIVGAFLYMLLTNECTNEKYKERIRKIMSRIEMEASK